jgi:site-specific DNA-methyltransferase (adenine-specific)
MNLLNRVAHMDIFDLCDCIDDNSIDMILCDLPYGITACEWDSVIPFEPMWEAFKRIIKPRGAIVLTASGKFTYQLVMSNFEMFKYEWVWIKNSVSMPGVAHKQPLRVTEAVLVFNAIGYYPQGLKSYNKIVNKGNKAGGKVFEGGLNSGNAYLQQWTNYPRNVLKFERINNNQHPTQKPVALFEYLIRTYTQPGDVVFDPCVGSGTTAIAARNTGRNFIVGDNSAEYVQVARERLAKPYTMSMFEEAVKVEQAQQMEMEW